MYPNVQGRMPYSKWALPRYEIYHCLITLYALLVHLFARLDHQLVNTRLYRPTPSWGFCPDSLLEPLNRKSRSSSAALCHEAWLMPAPWGGWRGDGGAAATRPLIGRAGRHCAHLSLRNGVLPLCNGSIPYPQNFLPAPLTRFQLFSKIIAYLICTVNFLLFKLDFFW